MMLKLLLSVLLLSLPVTVPALAQTKPTPKAGAASRVDVCAPIGRTARGELVYAMTCDSIPPPPPAASPPQAEAAPTPTSPAAERDAQRGGIFGWSFDHRGDQ